MKHIVAACDYATPIICRSTLASTNFALTNQSEDRNTLMSHSEKQHSQEECYEMRRIYFWGINESHFHDQLFELRLKLSGHGVPFTERSASAISRSDRGWRLAPLSAQRGFVTGHLPAGPP